MKDDSESELNRYVQDVNDKWKTLSEQAKNQLRARYKDFDGLIKGNFSVLN
jgi:hypothetical protein